MCLYNSIDSLVLREDSYVFCSTGYEPRDTREMAVESKVTTVVPLSGTNHSTWKVQCKMALIREGLWDIVTKKEVAPADETTKQYADFMARYNRALATIVLTVDPTLLYLLEEPDSPVTVWEKLSNQFQKKTWVNKLILRRKLYVLRYKDGDSVHQHIKAMTEIFNELSVIGVEIGEEDRVVHLLASLLTHTTHLLQHSKSVLKFRRWRSLQRSYSMKIGS